MTSSTMTSRASWADRWTKPSLDGLLDSLKAHHRRQFVSLIDKLQSIPGMSQSIQWYGPSWKWTIIFTWQPVANGATVVKNGNGKKVKGQAGTTVAGGGNQGGPSAGTPGNDAFCYLVPNTESPVVCIPLREQQAEKLSAGSLSRYVRESVNNAKCAVSIRWATWSPATENESTQLLELIKKKWQMQQEERQAGH